MRYFKHNKTEEVYAYEQADLDVAAQADNDTSAVFRSIKSVIDNSTELSGEALDVFLNPPTPEPVPFIPASVSRAQGKAALIQMGLWADIVDYVDSIEDATTKALAEVALNDTQEWQRDSPFLNQCADAIGITPEQLDELFIQASEIVL